LFVDLIHFFVFDVLFPHFGIPVLDVELVVWLELDVGLELAVELHVVWIGLHAAWIGLGLHAAWIGLVVWLVGFGLGLGLAGPVVGLGLAGLVVGLEIVGIEDFFAGLVQISVDLG
jgi:hypothetical protein